MVDFWIEVNQHIFGLSAAAPPEKQKKTTPPTGPVGVRAV